MSANNASNPLFKGSCCELQVPSLRMMSTSAARQNCSWEGSLGVSSWSGRYYEVMDCSSALNHDQILIVICALQMWLWWNDVYILWIMASTFVGRGGSLKPYVLMFPPWCVSLKLNVKTRWYFKVAHYKRSLCLEITEYSGITILKLCSSLDIFFLTYLTWGKQILCASQIRLYLWQVGLSLPLLASCNA